ncbi:unnamed protein product [Aspergillus oryzae]|uniref:Unnamed protein product n=2 Tax=Aspergillus oryzae TaxID=5062 RepID=A0AAN5BYQ6_ASPOZ|nr:unnamed protein product [Aspergillus oryzae]GMF91638.1 unnamed protein product [Aspergillus oryzae]GMG04793.1 unnamed protein product [Aspergillus oryzae]GMG32144.1 unnamed protein product [Aspergillus oryzae]GMG51076.1 unnamed protein product [Aspergillus oryzae var. brunneus]
MKIDFAADLCPDVLRRTLNGVRVIEFSTLPFSESIRLDLLDSDLSTIKRNTEYHFMVNDTMALLTAREVASNFSNLYTSIADVTRPAVDFSILLDNMNLVILRIGCVSSEDLKYAITNARSVLIKAGIFLPYKALTSILVIYCSKPYLLTLLT